MKPPAFAYVAPSTVDELLGLLAQYGADARIVAGGQTLGPMLNMRMVSPAVLVDINNVAGLDKIEKRDAAIHTGALVRQRTTFEDRLVGASQPLLPMALRFVGHFQTRTRGTLCGSIAHADPTAELPLALLLLDGAVRLQAKRKTRIVSASDFFEGALTTARQPEEFIAGVQWPIVPETRYFFDEISVRHGHIAVAACAMMLQLDDDGVVTSPRLGVTGVSDRPLLVDVAGFVRRPATAEWAAELSRYVQGTVPTIDDLHASAAYRRSAVGFLIRKMLADVPYRGGRTP